MKKATKASSFWRVLFDFVLCTIVISMTGCVDLPPSITGEPDETVINAPRDIGRPPSYDKDNWPNLADVPDMPTAFVPQSEWKEISDGLAADRVDSEEAKARMLVTAPDFKPIPNK